MDVPHKILDKIGISYCMPQTVGHVRLDTLEEWYQEANVSTISFEEDSFAFPVTDPRNGRGVPGILYRCYRDLMII